MANGPAAQAPHRDSLPDLRGSDTGPRRVRALGGSGHRSFIVTGAIRAPTIVLMAAGYLLVDPHNYLTFLGVAALFGVVALALIARFDLPRRIHVISQPLLAADGSQLHQDGRNVAENIVVGTEDAMRQAREDFVAAQRITHGLSLSGNAKPWPGSPIV